MARTGLSDETLAWAGRAVFTAVLLAVIAGFWWLLL